MPNYYQDALAYATSRKVLLPQEFYGEIPLKARQWAFTVSRLTQLDQIQQVLNTLNTSLAKGSTFKQWQADVANGKIKVNLSPHHADNVFRTNIQSAYSQGRWAAQERNLADAPYLMYDAINDSRTRPTHAAMDGHIAPADDPIWKEWYAPTGYRCRCTVISLTEEEARARGYTGQPAPNVAPDQGWAYDRRGNWQQGIQNSINRRLNQCQSHQFAPNNGQPSWCAPGKLRNALNTIEERLQETPDQSLKRELQAGMRGERYQQALSKITHLGPLSEPEAVALLLWSGDTAKEKPYQVIGQSIRSLGRNESPKKAKAAARQFTQVAAIVAGVNRALKKLPPANLEFAYRVIQENKLPPSIKKEFMASHTAINSKVQYNSFTAFSSDYDKAWKQFGGTDDSWVLIIKKPKQLKSIVDYTVLDASEHLAPMMVQYKVVEVDMEARKVLLKEVAEDKKTNLGKSAQFALDAEAAAERESIDAIFKYMREVDERVRKEQASPDYVPPVLTEEQKRWGEIMNVG